MRMILAAAITLANFLAVIVTPINAATVVTRAALGAYITAPMLLSACMEKDPGIHCDPYIAGVLDSITSNRGVFENNQICIPAGTSIDVFRDLVVKFIQTHGEFPQDSIAASEVATAITEAYPCVNRSN